MAYLVVKRYWNEELVPVCAARTSGKRAAACVAFASCQPGQRIGESQPGDVWIEVVHDRTGDLLIDPVIFPPEAARPVLVQLGMDAEMLATILSEAHVAAQLAHLRAMAVANAREPRNDTVSTIVDKQEGRHVSRLVR